MKLFSSSWGLGYSHSHTLSPPTKISGASYMPTAEAQTRTTLNSMPLTSLLAHLSRKVVCFPTRGKGGALLMIMPHRCKLLTMLRYRRHSLYTPTRIYWSLSPSIQRDSMPPIFQRTATSRSRGHKTFHGICSCPNELSLITLRCLHFLVRYKEAQTTFSPAWEYPQM